MPYTNVIDRHQVTVLSGTTHFECDADDLKLPKEYRHWPSLLNTTLGDGKQLCKHREIFRATHANHAHTRVDVLYVQLSTGVTLLVHA